MGKSQSRSLASFCARLLHALIAVALLWGLPCWVAITSPRFAAMLHPCEFSQSNLLGSIAVAFLIANPKTRRWAKHQHGRCSVRSVVKFLGAIYARWSLQVLRLRRSLRRSGRHLEGYAAQAQPSPTSIRWRCRRSGGEADGGTCAPWSSTYKRWQHSRFCLPFLSPAALRFSPLLVPRPPSSTFYVSVGGLRPWLDLVATGVPPLPRAPKLHSDQLRRPRRSAPTGC